MDISFSCSSSSLFLSLTHIRTQIDTVLIMLLLHHFLMSHIVSHLRAIYVTCLLLYYALHLLLCFSYIKILLFSQSRLDACAIMLLFFNWEQWSKWHCVFLMLCNGAMDQCRISKAIMQFVKFNIIKLRACLGTIF